MKNTTPSTFYWEGLNPQGCRLKGTLRAEEENEIKSILSAQGITLLKLRKKFTLWQNKASIKPQLILEVFRQLSALLDADLPLASCLQILAHGQNNLPLKLLINTIKTEVEQGHALAEILQRYPQYFDSLCCNLIATGEQSGTLNVMLLQWILYYEKMQKLKQKIKKALFYPATVLTMGFLVGLMLLLFVVPQFKSLYAGFGAELPLYTQWCGLAGLIKNYIWLLIFFILILTVGIRYYKTHNPHAAYHIDRLLLHVPLLQKFLAKIMISRFTRTLAITFNAGLPVADALHLVANSCGNLVYARAIVKAAEQILTGQSMHSAMADSQIFPHSVTQMIAIAEETGTLSLMLIKIADFYDYEIDNIVDNIGKLIEPAIMAVVGILIGSLIAAMYLPIFRLGNVI